MSETEPEVPFEEPAPEASPDGDEPTEVPDGVDPETGEVTEDEPAEEEAEEDPGDEARRRELAAERQQQEQEAAQAQADAEKLMKSLNKTADNYAKRVVDLLGGDLTGWQACPLCAEGLPGFRVPVMPSPEHLAAVKVAIGEDPDPPLKSDDYSRVCDGCEGHGKVLTGSNVPGQKAAQCYKCKGRGWLAVGSERESGAITAANGAPASTPGVLQDNPTNEPPEAAMLRQLGYIVVEPVTIPDVPGV